MVVAIDAVHHGAELKARSDWRTEPVNWIPIEEPQQGSGILAPARGMFWGLLLSLAIWVGLAVVVRAVLAMVH